MARVELLSLFIAGIAAMLRDDDHTVHRELVATQGERFGDGGIELQAVALNALLREITLRELIDVNRGDFESRFLPLATPPVTERQAVEKVLGVGVGADLGPEKGDPFLLFPLLLCGFEGFGVVPGKRKKPGAGGGAETAEKTPP